MNQPHGAIYAPAQYVIDGQDARRKEHAMNELTQAVNLEELEAQADTLSARIDEHNRRGWNIDADTLAQRDTITRRRAELHTAICEVASDVFDAHAARATDDMANAARRLAEHNAEAALIVDAPGAVMDETAVLDWLAIHGRAAFYRACYERARLRKLAAWRAELLALDHELTQANNAARPAFDAWQKAYGASRGASLEFQTTPEYIALAARADRLRGEYDAANDVANNTERKRTELMQALREFRAAVAREMAA